MADGQEALSLLGVQAQHPDAVLCDLDMDGRDGIELLRHLAERGYSGQVILMSGARDDVLATARDLAHLHGLHLAGVLRKPVDAEALRQVLVGPYRVIFRVDSRTVDVLHIRHASRLGLDPSAVDPPDAI